MPNDASAPIPPATRPVRYLELLTRAVAYIDAHLETPLSAELLAERAAMSRYHFHRIFRAYFGTTVSGYITWRRLQQACTLLAAGDRPVLEVALAVGYESAQALAKAMRRELDTTPSAVRAGSMPNWQRMFDRRSPEAPSPAFTAHDGEDSMLKPQMIDTPELPVLTTTGRGMHQGNMMAAAQQAFGELMPALARAGLQDRTQSCLALFPDEPQGPEDNDCRLLAGAVFDYSLAERSGAPTQPEIALEGTLAWHILPAGRHAVFLHVGPYSELHHLWRAIYAEWLPATGYAVRDALPFELYVNDASVTPPHELRTAIFLPLQ